MWWSVVSSVYSCVRQDSASATSPNSILGNSIKDTQFIQLRLSSPLQRDNLAQTQVPFKTQSRTNIPIFQSHKGRRERHGSHHKRKVTPKMIAARQSPTLNPRLILPSMAEQPTSSADATVEEGKGIEQGEPSHGPDETKTNFHGRTETKGTRSTRHPPGPAPLMKTARSSSCPVSRTATGACRHCTQSKH